MKWWLYNALFSVVYLAMMPSFLLRMKRRGGYRLRMADRFAGYPEAVIRDFSGMNGNAVWIHAVSVGEVQVAGQLMRSLRERDPSLRFVFSTTSSTGWKTAESQVTERDVLIYNPLDFPCFVNKALDLVNPRAVILTETEIWPNFIREIRRRGIPLFLANARISDRSAPRYRALRWFFGDIFRSFTKIYAQSDLDARRLADAGAEPTKIEVTGSYKFDVAKCNPVKEKELGDWIGGGRIMLGGSTWPGEDAVLLEIFRDLPTDVKLVIAPRHFEKADQVEANIRSAGFACVRRSRGDRKGCGGGKREVFLADTTGELMGLFGVCTATFVGKSLCEHGSQNMIEPCLCGVPTVVGPYTENFRPVMSDLLAAEALVQVQDAQAVGEIFKAVFDAENAPPAMVRRVDGIGERARAAVERRRGAVGRCAADILRFAV